MRVAMRWGRFTGAAFLAGGAIAWWPAPVFAQTDFTWSGALSGRWNELLGGTTNWLGEVNPPKSSRDTRLVFGASGRKTLSNDIRDPFTLNRLTFSDSGYTIDGGALEFQSSTTLIAPQLVQTARGQNTLNVGLSFTSLVVDIASGGTLRTTGATSVGGALTKRGAGVLQLAGDRAFNGTLSIEAGAIENQDARIGTGTAPGAATVAGATSRWSGRDLYVGDSGRGSLAVSGGALVESRNGWVGVNGPLSLLSAATVTGTGSRWTLSADLFVGGSGSGSGSLDLLAGATATCVTGYVGFSQRAIGSATVTGAGSSWTSTSLLIGASDTASGTLTLRDLGQATTATLTLGNVLGTSGTMFVDGATLTVTGTAPSTGVFLGHAGSGEITLKNGGVANVATTRLGVDPTGVGKLTVDGAGSVWNAGGIAVGFGGSGELTIENGGKVTSIGSTIGLNSTASGAVVVRGNGSRWEMGDSWLTIGNDGDGSLLIENGGYVGTRGLTLGWARASNATLTVTGAGSKLESLGSLVFGSSRTDGELAPDPLRVLVSDGGVIDVGTAFLFFYRSEAIVTIDRGMMRVGALSAATDAVRPQILLRDPTASQSALVVGGGNQTGVFAGTLADAAGGAGGFTKIGANNLTLTGANTFSGPTRIDGGSVILGNVFALRNSVVHVNVDNGLNLNGLTNVDIAGLAGSGNLSLGTTTLTLNSRSDSVYAGRMTGGAQAVIGKSGSGSQTFTGGTAANPTTFHNYYSLPTNTGATIFDGAYVRLLSTQFFTLSSALLNDNGAITVRNGGFIDATGGHVLLNGTTSGTSLIVAGVGSGVTASRITIGYTSGRYGTLDLSGGASARSTGSFELGYFAGASGTANVRGAGSRLSVDGSGDIGREGVGTLNISSGGAAILGGQLLVGRLGDGAVSVSSGGSLTINGSSSFLGAFPNAVGTILVTGAGATLSAPTQFQIGGAGNVDGGAGTLRVTGGGSANIRELYPYKNSTIQIGGSGAFPGGTLTAWYLISVGSSAATGTLQLLDPTATLVLGDVSLDVDQDATYNGAVTGNGSIVKLGLGRQSLLGVNRLSGDITVNAGTLSLGGNTIVDGGIHTVRGGGTLELQSGASVRNASLLGGAGGQYAVPAGASVAVRSSTLYAGASLNVAGSLTLTASTIAGTLVQESGAASLTWNGGFLTSGGKLSVAGVANLSGVELGGTTNIASGARLNNAGSPLTLGAGGKTSVGTKDAPGGTIDLGGSSLEVNGGLLVNNGVIQNGRVNVNYGGLVKGAGEYRGGYSVNDGGRILFGNSPGILSSGSSVWGAGGLLTFQIDDALGTAGVNWGLNRIDGALSILAGTTPASAFTISLESFGASGSAGLLANFDGARSYSWTFVEASGGISGFDTSRFSLDSSGFRSPTGGGSFSIGQSGDRLVLNFSPAGSSVIPEPATIVLAGLGVWVVGVGRFRGYRKCRAK